MEAFNILPDPQTNGGLLIAVKEAALADVSNLLAKEGYNNFIQPVGRMIAKEEQTIHVTSSVHEK